MLISIYVEKLAQRVHEDGVDIILEGNVGRELSPDSLGYADLLGLQEALNLG